MSDYIRHDKGLLTYYVINKGEGVQNDYANVFLLYPMPNLITEGGGGLETDKKWLRNMSMTPITYANNIRHK